jgi:glyoxalase family protein
MAQLINGLHHVTALASDPQKNIDFYTGFLGLRLVKQTINFDSPDTYHFYFGDAKGNPGTIMTFFPFPDAMRGRKGTGQLTVTAFSIAPSALNFWLDRLTEYNIPYQGPASRFTEEVISLEDPDGLTLELVADERDTRTGWQTDQISAGNAVKGFHSVTLSEEGYERTAGLLTSVLEYRPVAEKGSRFRYEVGTGGPGTLVDIVCQPDSRPGVMGAGTVHHLAFRTSSDESQLALRKKLSDLHYNVSPVMDRQYFHSIYFREPGNILFEIATDPPGFALDETPESLGNTLKLPPWLEPSRDQIQAALPPIRLSAND